jgi:RNA polymerase sigma-70 factor, ECF subfamily
MATPVREATLVLRAQTGDRAALEELLASIQPALARYILQVVRRPSLSDDVLQEVFLRIYKGLAYLRDPELFRPWAYRIATRQAIQWLKKERAWSDPIDPDTAPEDLSGNLPLEPLDVEFRERWPLLLERLSPASRVVIHLHYWEEMSIDEVAAVLGVSAGTVKSRLAYGLMNLRKMTGIPALGGCARQSNGGTE